MTSLSPSTTSNTGALSSQYPQDTDCCANFHQNVYDFQELEENYTGKGRGYQKPKRRWMAKDQSMIVSSPSSFSSRFHCSDEVRTSEVQNTSLQSCDSSHVSQHFNIRSPIRNCYSAFSPSTSSSAPGTVMMPSSLTNTSSSPSNQTPLHSRADQNLTYISTPCISPGSESLISSAYRAGDEEYPPKPAITSLVSAVPLVNMRSQKQRVKRNLKAKVRTLNPKSKISKRRSKNDGKMFPLDLPLNNIHTEGCNNNAFTSFPEESASDPGRSPVVGGLKIRLRRDNSMLEPICSGKKARVRQRKTKSTSVFRIVESWCDADAPGGDFSYRALAAKSSAASPSSVNASAGSFRVGDVVWAKLAGYPYWPSRISALWARTAHQLADAGLPQHTFDSSSLAVLATPVDPSLAPGFVAKVDWLACEQCSYLSCAKLFPFRETYDKLYNPRTRVKGYADAVKIAKNLLNSSDPSDDGIKSSQHFPDALSQSPLPNTAPITLPTSNGVFEIPESQKYLQPLSFVHASENPEQLESYPLDLSLALRMPEHAFPNKAADHTSLLHFATPSMGLSDVGELYHDSALPDLAPLPQLDISGLGDIVSHVPTFSEDEDDIEGSVASQLKIQLSPIT